MCSVANVLCAVSEISLAPLTSCSCVMLDSRILPTWPPTAAKARNTHKRSTSATKASLARVAHLSVAAQSVHPAGGLREGSAVDVPSNDRSFFSTPIFSGDVGDHYSCDTSEEGTLDQSCSSLISTAPSTPPSDHHEGLAITPSMTKAGGRNSRVPPPTTESTTSLAGRRSHICKCEFECGGVPRETKERSSLSAKRQEQPVSGNPRARYLKGKHTVSAVGGSAGQATRPNAATDRAKTSRTRASLNIEPAGPADVVVGQDGGRPPQGKHALFNMPNGADNIHAICTRLVKSQTRPRWAVEAVPMFTAQSPSSPLESEVARDVFGGDGFVAQRNGMHTAWRRANPAPHATAASCPQPPPVAEGMPASHPTTADTGVVDDKENVIPAEKEQQSRRVCLRRHFVPPPSAGKNNPTTSNNGDTPRSPAESRVFLRRHGGLSARPTRENVQTAADAPSSVRGVDSSSYNSSGGAKRRTAGEGKKPPPEPRASRSSGAPLEHLADVAVVPRRRVVDSRRVSAPAVLEGRVVGRFEAGSGQATSSQYRSHARLRNNGSPDRPVDRGILAPRAATPAPLSSAAARKNLATVARKSKVGTKADPVTLYRERQEAEVRRTSAAARKRAARREGRDCCYKGDAPAAVGYFGARAGGGGKLLQFSVLR